MLRPNTPAPTTMMESFIPSDVSGSLVFSASGMTVCGAQAQAVGITVWSRFLRQQQRTQIVSRDRKRGFFHPRACCRIHGSDDNRWTTQSNDIETPLPLDVRIPPNSRSRCALQTPGFYRATQPRKLLYIGRNLGSGLLVNSSFFHVSFVSLTKTNSRAFLNPHS